jgi:hypothetical protein
MITQEILKYKKRFGYWGGNHYHNDRPHMTPTQIRGPREYSKLEYAEFLKTIPFKVGDLVCSNFTGPADLPSWSVYRVAYIEELHHNVKNWPYTAESQPECVTLEDALESRRLWTAIPKNFKKYTGVIPPEWKERMVRDEAKKHHAHNNN